MDWLTGLILIIVVLWVLGISFASSVGGLIHLLLVVALILIVLRLARGQKL